MNYQVWTTNDLSTAATQMPHGKLVDIHPKTGSRLFCADPDDIFSFMIGKLPDEEFGQRYVNKLNEVYRAFPTAIQSLMKYETLIIGCQCHSNDFCQRYLFAEWYVQLLTGKNQAARFMGEVATHA